MNVSPSSSYALAGVVAAIAAAVGLGIVLAITVLGINLVGDGLRDVLDPRIKIEGR